MRKLLVVSCILLTVSFCASAFVPCTYTQSGNLSSSITFASIINCDNGDVVLNNMNSNPGGDGKVTFTTDVTLNSLTINFASGNKPVEFIIPVGVTVTITTDLIFAGQADKDKFITVEGTLNVGGTLDFGDVEFEIDGSGSISATDIIGASDVTCAAADGGTGTCPLVTADTCDDATNDFCATSVMPIVLTYFGANPLDNAVELKWTTASEENNDYFTIERSANGLEFEELSRVDGAGNSFEILDYRLLDKRPISGVSYYRLKQTDYDGTNATFKVVAVEFYGNGDLISITKQLGSDKLVISNNFDIKNVAYIYMT